MFNKNLPKLLGCIGCTGLLFGLVGCAGIQLKGYEHRDSRLWDLKYNYMENEWIYAPAHAQLNYNYMENRWEYSK